MKIWIVFKAAGVVVPFVIMLIIILILVTKIILHETYPDHRFNTSVNSRRYFYEKKYVCIENNVNSSDVPCRPLRFHINSHVCLHVVSTLPIWCTHFLSRLLIDLYIAPISRSMTNSRQTTDKFSVIVTNLLHQDMIHVWRIYFDAIVTMSILLFDFKCRRLICTIRITAISICFDEIYLIMNSMSIDKSYSITNDVISEEKKNNICS